MTERTSIRAAAVLALTSICMAGRAQVSPLSLRPPGSPPSSAPSSALPPTPPTASSKASPSPAGTTPTPAQKSARRADVTFANGQLAVKAENSSLNLILREIGRQTGIKITGGVTEERVYGSYGPASTAEVLNRLLDGTGSNVLLIATDGTAPGELVLTPRQGGPTPPNPNAKGFDDDSDEDGDAAQTPRPRGVTLFGGPVPAEAPPATAPANQPSAPPVSPAIGADPNAANPTTNPQSPNGVKTPQEIYQQLQQLRQQQQPQPTTDTPPQ